MEIDRPTAADYANRNAEEAKQIAEGAAKADAASREELEKQVFVLRGQVSFLASYMLDLLSGDETYFGSEDRKTLVQIKDNKW